MKTMIAGSRQGMLNWRAFLLSMLALILVGLPLWLIGVAVPNTMPAVLAVFAGICLVIGLLMALVNKNATAGAAPSFFTLAALSLCFTLFWTWRVVLANLVALLPNLGLVFLLTLVGQVVQTRWRSGARPSLLASLGISALPILLVAGCYLLIGTSFELTAAELRLALGIGLAITYFNLMAAIFGGETPLDGGVQLRDGQRLLGEGKTWRGSLAGLVLATLAFLFFTIPDQAASDVVYLGVLVSGAAFFGDAGASFLKRRLGQKPGAPVPLLDQWDCLIPLLILIGFWPSLKSWQILMPVLMLATLFIQLFGNRILYQLGKKCVPW